MPTVVYTVQASHDDTYFYVPGSQCLNESAVLSLRYDDKTGIRFRNFPLSGATHIIVSCHLRLRSYSGGQASISIYGNDTDDAAIFEAPNCNPANRAGTTAYVGWGTGVMVGGSWYETDDLTAVLNEILARPGYAAGNAIAFLLSTFAGDLTFYSFDGGSPPELHVTYKPIYQGGGIL